MQGSTKIPITDLNAHITCKICNGYFVDASTIIECLHTFCRSCIIKYLQKNKYCPVCDVQVHKSKPLLNIRPDKTLQDIVYKLVPRLFQNEMQRRRQFYESHPEAKPSSLEQCGEVAYQYLLTPEETICLTLSYHGADNKPRYLRCPAAVTMGHLKKLIRAKYDLSENHRVDILYNQDCLSSSLTLIDIAYIYLWKRKGPLELTYRIYENTAKKLKFEHSDDAEKLGINNINNNDISNNNNWKEVQLRISENGEMSITGIQDSLSPSLLEIVNSEPKYKNDVGDPKALVKQQQQIKKELPGLNYIGKVNTPCTLPPTTSNPLPIDNLNNFSVNVGNFVNTISTTVPTLTLPIVSDHIILSQPSPSSNCATLSSGSTTTVFSTINTSKCSTKTEESAVNVAHTDENKEREGEKGMKRKIEANFESEPPAKQPKPIILNHNIGLHNLSNNHPLMKHAKMNRNGENVRDLPKAKVSFDSDIKSTEATSILTKSNDIEIMKQSFNKKTDVDTSKINLNKNFAHGRMGSSTSTSKPLAMRAKTLISESGVKPPCYQPRTIYNPLINVPRPLNNLNSATTVSISLKPDSRTPPPCSTRTMTVKKTDKSSPISITTSQPTVNSTPKSSITSQSQPNHTITKPTSIVLNISNKPQSSSPTPLSQPVVSTSNKIPSISPAQQAQSQCNSSGNKVPSTSPSQVSPNSIQGINNKLPITSPSQQLQPTQSTSTKTSTTISTTPPQSCQNAVAKTPNSTVKAKPSTPIGYKTLRDPPKSWNSQISKANLSKSSPDPKYPDLKNVRPAKFFKMRNNMPRYLGNPASGVKPMYQVHVSPEKDKPQETMKTEKCEIKKHSIVKIDPKTLKPVSEKAPETTSLSNHSIILQTPNLNPHNLTNQMSQLYPNPSQCLNTAVTTMNSSLLNIQNDLKINTSSVSITNPLKLQSSSPKNERKSPKSPHSPKMKTTSSPTGNKRDNKIARNFTPPNPFVPNIPTKPSLSPNQFIYPAMPPGFPTYDPRVMAAYYNQWYSQRMPFSPSALSGLTLDLNQRKSLEILTSPGSPNIDVLAQSMLNHQMPPRPIPPTSTNISTLQRSHNIPLSPTIAKLPSAHKKAQKEPKIDKSLETVVEKMTQNRNKITTKSQKQPEVSKTSAPLSSLETHTNDVCSGKKPLDQKAELNTIEINDCGTNQLLKIATSNTDKNVQQTSDKADFKDEQKSKEPLKSSSNSKISDQTESKPEKATEPHEKENSNTENNVQSKEKLVDRKSEVISTEDSGDKREKVAEVEVKEKE